MNKPTHHRARFAARLALGLGASFVAANAKDAHYDFGVSATVLAVAHLELQSEPAALTLSRTDIERGFINIAQPTTLVIRSNSQSGYELELMTTTPMVSSMVVYGLDSQVALGAEGGRIAQRWQGSHRIDLNLKYRFSLAAGLRPGSYPWPVRLAVRPLESL